MYLKYIKRPMDIVLSLLAIIFLSPILAVIAILVRIKLGSPVLFKQQRPGKDGKIFNIYKFRSMTDAKDENGKLLPDEARLTRFGKLLRKTSLDELPELFCILKGDMSIIGPRPLLVSYLPYYTEEESHRHDVRPGLSGLAQIEGRNYLDWDSRLATDIEYVKNVSFALDVSIIFKTIIKAFKGESIAEDTNAIEGNLAEIRKEKLNAEVR